MVRCHHKRLARGRKQSGVFLYQGRVRPQGLLALHSDFTFPALRWNRARFYGSAAEVEGRTLI
jgi:hypothetical protein